MKTKSIIFLSNKLEELVNIINDDLHSYEIQEFVDYYIRATNVFGFIVYESVFNWLQYREYNYDREIVRENITPFQWSALISIEHRYFNILLKNDNVRNDPKIDIKQLISN